MNINRIFYILLLLGGTGSIYAAGSNSHADPMAVLNDRGSHADDNTQKDATPPKASRHFSPLDALNGRIVTKDSPDTNINTPKEKLKPENKARKNSKIIHKAKKQRSKNHNNDNYDATMDYSIENTEDAPDSNTHTNRNLKTDYPEEGSFGFTKGGKKENISPSTAPNNKTPITKKSKIKIQTDTDKPQQIDNKQIGSESPAKPAIPLENLKPISKNHPYHTSKPKTLYMTFDDGPCAGTANLLRLIREEGVSATMFYIGRNVAKRHKLFSRAVSIPNVLVANHTYSHANNHYQRFYSGSVKSVVSDINRAQKLIGGAKYLRLAGRNVWRLPAVHRDDWGISVAHRSKEVDKYNTLSDRGYYIYGWDAEWLFSHKTQKPLFGGEEMARRVNLIYNSGKSAKKGKLILLAHDYLWKSTKDLAKLRTFIHIMRADGWKFDTIDTYSSSTPDVLMSAKSIKKRDLPLKPAQKIAKKASVLPGVSKKLIASANKAPNGNKKFENGLSALCKAIREQDFIVIRKLLANGVDVNKKDSKGEIPLNIAIKTNNAVLVKMLVDRGARIFNIDAYGMSPMGIARQHQNTIIIKYLIKQIEKQKKQKLRHTLFAMK